MLINTMWLDNSHKPSGDQYLKRDIPKLYTYFTKNFVKMCSADCIVTRLQAGRSRFQISMGVDLNLFIIYQCHSLRAKSKLHVLEFALL